MLDRERLPVVGSREAVDRVGAPQAVQVGQPVGPHRVEVLLALRRVRLVVGAPSFPFPAFPFPSFSLPSFSPSCFPPTPYTLSLSLSLSLSSLPLPSPCSEKFSCLTHVQVPGNPNECEGERVIDLSVEDQDGQRGAGAPSSATRRRRTRPKGGLR